ncbi:AraC family transcriptional regulator [Aquimarina sp. D1M17]|uniref:helix-turn-helix domain-containing protein n=1 Tax=Aquimarina acroporae TaxID=2937283 RepID=UPI0020BE3EDB|nr:AraC family transcriptional regulator [Aquimarina acroporae]MCK8520149.1 AraC family transcriptional regulator [Aquimarina acroporae]
MGFFAVLVFVLLDSYAFIHKLKFVRYLSFFPAHGSKLLLGPLMMMYVQSLFFDDKRVITNAKLYFLPFLMFFLGVSIPYLFENFTEQLFPGYVDFLKNRNFVIRILLDITFLLFLVKSFQLFFKFKILLKCNYSHIEYNNFIWVRYLLVAPTLVILLDIAFGLYQLYFGPFLWRSQNIVMVGVVISLMYAAYFGINQSKVLVPYFLLIDKGDESTQKKEINITQLEAFEELEKLLVHCMQHEKPYLDEELTLNKLASAIGTTDKKLSMLLNQHIENSFYNFVNLYRIQEFKTLAASPLYDDYTIEGIAYECGFKSKASFYRLFKKETGLSPSEYIKNHR